ncbi:penicillin-binding protein 2 [Candidatus Daviesbacteria bacterium]|nr:penicillin-binding protein 2 [Candidatus Daviesbacteria bacterium]
MTAKKRNLGPGFTDEVAKVTSKIGSFKKGESVDPDSIGADWTDVLLPNFHPHYINSVQRSPWRIIFFSGLCLILFFIIFLRLFHLQIVEGYSNRELADGNRIQIKVIHAPRGVIYDRNGKILAANSPAFRLIDPKSTSRKVKLVSRDQALEWEVKNDPRVANLEIDNVRNYPMGEKFAHVLGYMGEISGTQIKANEFKNYRPGDQIGKAGVEAEYEKLLRGVDGGEIIEVDSKGQKIRTLRLQSPIPGQNIYLSIDASLQEKLYLGIKDTLDKVGSCCGMAVVMDPSNGKVLALVSLPSFDPNIFNKNEDDSAISQIFSRDDSPVLNRVIGGIYPPGSTFKIISSLAALASGKITSDTTFEDNGVMFLGPYKFSNWYFNEYGKVEGLVNLQKALMRSNDIYYYKVAQIIGENVLADWSRKLHLGSKIGIDLPGEEGGLVPDNAWKQKNYNTPWYPGDTLHMAIGQGFVLVTPLQILGITSYIAADGVLYKPELLLSSKPQVLVSKLLPKDKIDLIKAGLKLVPKSGGTAWPFFTFPIETAGKTGTAEYGDPKDRTHAWYTSFAPADDPKIVMTVLIEGGGEGSTVAAPIVKEAYRYYFSPDKNKLIQDIYPLATQSARTLGE